LSRPAPPCPTLFPYTTLFRSMRHARAKEVCVRLVSEGGLLRISIADNGKGITRPQINDRKSFGLVGMRERVHRIGGEFNIFSLPGRGTRLDISIPLK